MGDTRLDRVEDLLNTTETGRELLDFRNVYGIAIRLFAMPANGAPVNSSLTLVDHEDGPEHSPVLEGAIHLNSNCFDDRTLAVSLGAALARAREEITAEDLRRESRFRTLAGIEAGDEVTFEIPDESEIAARASAVEAELRAAFGVEDAAQARPSRASVLARRFMGPKVGRQARF